jgi:hypothetical protein
MKPTLCFSQPSHIVGLNLRLGDELDKGDEPFFGCLPIIVVVCFMLPNA